MNSLDVNQAVALLQKSNEVSGGSVYDHLTELVGKIIAQRPADGVDLLQMSMLAKRSAAAGREEVQGPACTQVAPQASCSAAVTRLFGEIQVPINPETGEPEEAQPPNEYECENVLADSALLDACGAGLGRQEMYGAMLACKRIGEDPKLGVATVRFFGKVLGIYADYYVFETTLKEQADEEETVGAGEVPSEKGGGTNGYTYFVCNSLGGPLAKLPAVKPAQIKAARLIKKYLTGKLDATVSAYPPFPGNEASFLRAQLARIAATTVLSPAGYFVANESGGLDKAEEYTPVAATELGTAAAWAHRYPHVKKQGRCVVFAKEPEEGQDAPEPTEEEAEQGPEPLSTVEKDVEVGGAEAWTPLFSSSNSSVKNQVAGVRSNLWPGAVAVGSGSAFTNIYVGWAAKTAPFVPLPPPPVAKEYDQALVESAELPVKPEPVKEEAPAEEAE